MLRRHQNDRTGRALAAMYRDHATAAYRYAVHVSGSREDADDLVQAAFLEAHRHLVRGGTIMNPRAWLATVVRTRASNLRRDRHEAAASDRLETLAAAVHPDRADAQEELDRVRAVLYELPEAQHQAFVLRYWSDLSYRDIAAVLDTTESAVESLLVRARAAIVSRPDIPDACLAVRKHLSSDSLSAPGYIRHLDECARCRAAQTRLARAAGIAAAVALVPRIHVAQALAATVPGFSAAAAGAAGTVSAGSTTLAAGKAGITIKAAITALALAGSAALVHTHVQPHHNPAPLDAPPSASAQAPAPTAAPRTLGPSRLATAAPPLATGVTAPTSKGGTNGDTGPSPDGSPGENRDSSPTADTQGQDGSSDGDTQGQDESSSAGASGTDTPGGNTTASGGGSTGSGGSQDSQDGSSQHSGSPNPSPGNDNS